MIHKITILKLLSSTACVFSKLADQSSNIPVLMKFTQCTFRRDDPAKQGEQIEAPRPEQEPQGRRDHEQLELDPQPQKPWAPDVVVEALEQ